MTHEAHGASDTHEARDHSAATSALRWIGRLLIISVILMIVSFLTPGFTINGLWSFILAAVVISVLDYLVEAFMKIDAKPFGRGLKGFIISAIIIYVAQFLVPGMSVTILGAILGALAIGLLDAIFPVRVM